MNPITNNDEKLDVLRDYIEKYREHDTTLLFQRVNYFLIATSFLLTAFIATINSKNFTFDPNYKFWWIALVIAFVGFCISYGFLVANFINARIIYEINICLRDLEKMSSLVKDKASFNQYLYTLIPKHKFGIISVIKPYLHTITYFPYASLEEKFDNVSPNIIHKDIAPHTWLIPAFMSLVWLVIILITFLPWPYNSFAIMFVFFVSLCIRILIINSYLRYWIVCALNGNTLPELSHHPNILQLKFALTKTKFKLHNKFKTI
jgi:hypothetical protein